MALLFNEKFAYSDGVLTTIGSAVWGVSGFSSHSPNVASHILNSGLFTDSAAESTTALATLDMLADFEIGILFNVRNGTAGPLLDSFSLFAGPAPIANFASTVTIDVAQDVSSTNVIKLVIADEGGTTHELFNVPCTWGAWHILKWKYVDSTTTTTLSIDNVPAGSWNDIVNDNGSSAIADIQFQCDSGNLALITNAAIQAASGTFAATTTPAGLAVATTYSNGFALTWTAVTSAMAYRVYISTDSYATAVYDGPAPSATISGLAPSTAYSFKVTAYNPAGETAKSSLVSGTTSASLPFSAGVFFAPGLDPRMGDIRRRPSQVKAERESRK